MWRDGQGLVMGGLWVTLWSFPGKTGKILKCVTSSYRHFRKSLQYRESIGGMENSEKAAIVL